MLELRSPAALKTLLYAEVIVASRHLGSLACGKLAFLGCFVGVALLFLFATEFFLSFGLHATEPR